MISRDRLGEVADDLDTRLRAALNEAVRTQEPSAGVREALLRAAADEAQRRAKVMRAHAERPAAYRSDAHADMWRDWNSQITVDSPTRVLMFHAQLLNLRVVQ